MEQQNYPSIMPLSHFEDEKILDEMTEKEKCRMAEADKEKLSELDKEKIGFEEDFDEESATFMDD